MPWCRGASPIWFALTRFTAALDKSYRRRTGAARVAISFPAEKCAALVVQQQINNYILATNNSNRKKEREREVEHHIGGLITVWGKKRKNSFFSLSLSLLSLLCDSSLSCRSRVLSHAYNRPSHRCIITHTHNTSVVFRVIRCNERAASSSSEQQQQQ